MDTQLRFLKPNKIILYKYRTDSKEPEKQYVEENILFRYLPNVTPGWDIDESTSAFMNALNVARSTIVRVCGED